MKHDKRFSFKTTGGFVAKENFVCCENHTKPSYTGYTYHGEWSVTYRGGHGPFKAIKGSDRSHPFQM